MGKISDYEIHEKINETRRSVVYRGNKGHDSGSVIIKVLKTRYPTPLEIARFRQEYELIKSLDLKGIIKTFDIIGYDEGFALILEDFDGVSIKSLLDKKKRVDLKSFLKISAKIADTLGNLHLKGVIHGNIKPHSILINPITEDVKITDFGISAILTHEKDEGYNLDFIAGTMAYMSPEQTGRMNRTVDYRTDLYSFGVTMYEMLTGSLPFKSHDPMELIHSHIAVMPESPAILDSGIPGVISDIIMKLLSKNPGERYQNSLGLMADIEECLRRLGSRNSIDKFPLASRDISIKFNIPQVIVGREEESKVLMSAFERSTRGASEMMFVLGPPGIGKSALIYEIQRPIVDKKGYFIFGKYEQLRKDVPYSSIIQAFQGLIKQLISESDERINSWREKLIAALGPNGRIITDVIPDMEYIIGKQPDVESLGPEESQNRFNIVLHNFINVFTTADHPLTLFLDDLQWADLASLNLIKTIMTGSTTKFLFLVGAYRDNEVSPHHTLSVTLDELQKKGRKINSISLTPLNVANVNKMIMNVLRCKEEESTGLAELIHKKTGGNPFFIIQFLKNLYDSKIIELDPKTGWIWDMDKIQYMQFTDNVVDFMAGRILSLPVNTREILKVCACIGNRFDLETLSIVLGKTIEEVLADITAAIQEDLVSLHGNIYKFHHDRIQEAAYSLLTPAEREQIHFKIGAIYLERTPADQLFKRIFYIVDQLNHGRRLIETQVERNRLAQLNLKAGIKAKDSTAYTAASSYLKVGLELLPDGAWQTDYELNYALHKEQMECEYLNRNFDVAERLFKTIIANAKSRIDKAKAYNTMIVLYANLRSPKEAIELGLDALKLFGIKLSINMGSVPVLMQFIKVKRALGKISFDKIIDLPRMVDEEQIAISNLRTSVGTSAYYVNTKLWAYLSLCGVNASFKYGHTPNSAVGFSALATIIQNIQGDYELGYHIGEMALKLNEKINNKKVAGMIHHIFAFFIQHWKNHARKDIDVFRKVYQLSLNAGDFIYAGHSINAMADCRLMVGDRLDDIYDDLQKYRELMNIVKEPFISSRYLENIQMIRNLKGLTPGHYSLTGEGYDEDDQIKRLRADNNRYGLCCTLILKVELFYLYGKYEEALQAAVQLEEHIKVPIGTLLVAEHYFYYSLILTALLRQEETKRKRKFKAIVRRNQRKMQKWATLCPANFRHKSDLVEAEMLAIEGRYREAQILYHAAVEGARHNKYLQEEALACERLALFYLDGSDNDEAKMYMQRAYQCYNSWGASAKVKELEGKFPQLLSESMRPSAPDAAGSSLLTKTAGAHALDITTIIKTSQAISNEIDLDKLLAQIMKLSIENAGAEHGFLILENENDGMLYIEASGDARGNVEVLKAIPVEGNNTLSAAIVHYVKSTKEDIILNNASADTRFVNDPYIMTNSPKSILCAPIRYKGQMAGIIYLENNLTTDVFIPERIQLLQLLSAQAGGSIQNAILYKKAVIDGLTGLYTRAYFDNFLIHSVSGAERHKNKLSLLMIDIDHFKKVNDNYGHQAGDMVLKNLSDLLKGLMRKSDVAARYGGEEFVIVLTGTGIEGAMAAAEKIRQTVEKNKVKSQSGQDIKVTISIGVAEYCEGMDRIVLIENADKALYKAKEDGRNRVCVSVEK